jgi:dienelactone hydrolase
MEVEILIQNADLKGSLEIPEKAYGLVIFAHGSGSSRVSPRNSFVASELNKSGLATLLFDLLTEEEDKVPENRFNIDLLTERLIGVTKWCMEREETNGLKIGYFGASTGSAAALSAAAYWGTKIGAVVSRGGRPDLAMEVLDLIEAPTLLIVGGEDKKVIDYNRKAYIKIGCVKKMEIVAGATHLFEEEGALEKVAELARNWFERFLETGLNG